MQKHTNKIILILFCLLTLTSCGFRLQGYNVIPPVFKVLYLEADNPYQPFIVQLRNNLRSMDIRLTKTPQDANVILHIENVVFTQSLTSISANTQVRTYTLQYMVTFQLKNKDGAVVFGPQNIVSISTYSTSDAQLLADSDVLEMQKREMQRDVIMQMLYRINSQQGKQALAKI